MKRVVLGCLWVVLATMPVSAQTPQPTDYTLVISQGGAAVVTQPFTAGAATCGVDGATLNEVTDNPTGIAWADPADATKFCTYFVPTIFAGLAPGTYAFTLSATGTGGTTPSAESVPFPLGPPAAPHGLKVLRPSGL